MNIKLSMICIKQPNGSYFAYCPEIGGCFTQGDTYEEAVGNIKELVEITIKDDYSEDEIKDLISSDTKIFSELNIFV